MTQTLTLEKAQQLAKKLHDEESPDWEAVRQEDEAREVGS